MNQEYLFPISMLPEGFFYQPDFLTSEDEVELLCSIRALDFDDFYFHGYKAKRRVLQYGWDYDFESRKTSIGRPLPDFLHTVRERAAGCIGVTADAIVEALIAEYSPGAPIGWHRDVPQFETIVGISLLSECRMRLKEMKPDGRVTSMILEPRSIYVLRGAARWGFQHSISPVKNLRYSITFRTLRKQAEKKTA